MAKPGVYNIQTYLDDTLDMSFQFNDNADVPAPIDLSTATLKMQVRKKPGDPVLFEATEADGITIGGVGNNIVTISKICDAPAGVYVWDLQATFASGIVRTYLAGSFTVTADITK